MTGAGGSPVTTQTACTNTAYVFGYYGYDDTPVTTSTSKFGTASLLFYSN